MTTVVGVDLGGTKCLGLAVVDGEVAAEHRLPTPTSGPGVVDVVVDVVDALVARVGAPVAVGVGAPGLVDRGGVLRAAPNLPGGGELAIGPLVAARVRQRVVVDNDATCAAWGERVAGAAMGRDHVVVVTLGTGIGGGVICDGRLMRGANGFAGEIGHMVVDPDGPPCPCGHRGCWERYASGNGLGWLARRAGHDGRAAAVVALAGGDVDAVRGEHVAQAVAEGDADATAILGELAWWVALGLANLANVFDPELFVIGGGLVSLGDALLGPTRAAFAELVEAVDQRPAIDIVPARLGERAGAIGAAALARQAAG